MRRIGIAHGLNRGDEPRRQRPSIDLRLAIFGDIQHGRADLLGLKLREDALRRPEIAHADRLRGRAEDGLDRFAKLRLHRETLRDRHRLRPRQRRIEPALEDRLRSLAKSLPALLQLLE